MTQRADIVITEFMDDSAVADLAADYRVHYDPTLHKHKDALLAAGAGARALVVRDRTEVRGALLDGLPSLRVIGCLGVDLDNVDTTACAERGIDVLPATGAVDIAVAEYVVAGMLILLRGCYLSTAEVAAGRWPRSALIGREVSGRTLGLVGFGDIARQVARRAAGLGLKMLGSDPSVARDDKAWAQHWVRPVSLARLLEESDVISLHLRWKPGMDELIGADAIEQMKPGAIIINAEHGRLVDAAGLATALRNGRLGGALLDAFHEEPLGADNPFASVPNLILSPRIASLTEEANVRISAVTADNVRRVLEGSS